MLDRRQSGFTVVETLVATAVLGLVMVSALILVSSNQQLYRRGKTQAEVQQHARIALDAAAREIRMAGYDPSGVLEALSTTAGIQTANANDLSFVADLTGDGVLDKITYSLNDSRLMRAISSWTGSDFSAPVSSEMADGLSLLTFTYFDDTEPVNQAIGAPVASTDLEDIRRVTVSLVTAQTSVGEQQSFPLVVDVRLRN